MVTQSGIIIGQNLDYLYYLPQKFERMMPIQQFNNWYENNYNHNNQFYALISANNIQMGINEHGLSIFEESGPRPKDYKKQRRFQQPENGNAEGMIKYGILQNFNTVDEILPHLSKIFSVAQPDFYQIADDKKILTVEVAPAEKNNDSKRPFNYKIFQKTNEYFAHTNYYLSFEYASFNNYWDTEHFSATKNRFDTITDLITQSKTRSLNVAIHWLKNTRSNLTKMSDNNWCQNTSLFRSYLQGLKQIVVGHTKNNKIYGTVSTMIVNNNGNPKKSYLYLIMVDSITTNDKGQQLIKYKELYTRLDKLFEEPEPKFNKHELIRKAPINKICS
jgi:hypothetical protein